jgi:hypothetical protein
VVVETVMILLVVELFKVEFRNGNAWGSGNCCVGAVMFGQY